MGKEFRVVELAEPISQYTDAVRYGDLLFVWAWRQSTKTAR